MNKIKLQLEYNCFPMWIYDGNDIMLDNDLVSELSNNEVIDCLLTNIQEEFNTLFIDDNRVFGFKGFENEVDKLNFIKKVHKAYEIIKNEVGEIYIIENLIDISKL